MAPGTAWQPQGKPTKDIENLPHFVLLMIDGAVNANNFKYYDDLFYNYDNQSAVESSSPLKAMQQRLDQIYTERSKEYVKSKKDRVKAYKNDKIQELNQIVEDYAKVRATEFLDFQLPRLTQALQAVEYELRQSTSQGQPLDQQS